MSCVVIDMHNYVHNYMRNNVRNYRLLFHNYDDRIHTRNYTIITM